MSIHLRDACFPQDGEIVRALFGEYAAALGVDLGFQNFAAELVGLPGAYTSPRGCVLLAFDAHGTALGCVALRPLTERSCEMKRLFVRPLGRGRGLGRMLVEALLNRAGSLGYDRIFLDTLPDLQAAIALYRDVGFTACAPYTHNPLPGVLFLSRPLP